MSWLQREIQLPPFPRGLHLITRHVVAAMPEITRIEVGLLYLFLQHTSASLTINENADPDVPGDLERLLDGLAPESFPYRHTVEGPDDMPAHAKVSLTGSSLVVPLRRGQLCLGTWQGIYLWEHRRHAGARHLVLTAHGDP